MSFKAFISSTAIAGTLITGALVAPAPAEAATITVGSTLNLSNPDVFGGGVRRVGNTLDFYSASVIFRGNRFFINQRINVSGSTGSFQGSNLSSLIPPLPQVQDLALIAGGAPGLFTISGPVTGFITGVNLGLPSLAPVRFDLTSFIFNSTTGDAALEGIFFSGSDSIAARGRFTSQLDITDLSSYSFSITAVPTPALLPGLIGMGIAALRRKKEEAEENA